MAQSTTAGIDDSEASRINLIIYQVDNVAEIKLVAHNLWSNTRQKKIRHTFEFIKYIQLT